jgi:hypothetical protein
VACAIGQLKCQAKEKLHVQRISQLVDFIAPFLSVICLTSIFSVHNGVFQTSAPFSFRAGDKVTFSGAHVPPQIVLGNAYTILNTAPLSFELADLDSNGWNIEDNVAIFQARVWEGDASNNVKAAVQSNEPMSASLTKDSQSKTATSAPLLSNRSPAPTVHASSFSSIPANAVLKHVPRCSSGQRRSSRFTTHISPLPRNDAHDSVRSMNPAIETPTRYEKCPSFGSCTNHCHTSTLQFMEKSPCISVFVYPQVTTSTACYELKQCTQRIFVDESVTCASQNCSFAKFSRSESNFTPSSSTQECVQHHHDL